MFFSINEGEQKFEPPLFLKAEDRDESSVLRFRIVDGNTNNLFALNRLSGEISVRQRNGLRLDNIPTDMIRLSVGKWLLTWTSSKDSRKGSSEKIYVQILLFYSFWNSKWRILSQISWIWFQGYLRYGIPYLCSKITHFMAEHTILLHK